jgi:hypothetical protein
MTSIMFLPRNHTACKTSSLDKSAALCNVVLVIGKGLVISREPPPGLAEPDSWSETLQDFLTQCLQKVRRRGIFVC